MPSAGDTVIIAKGNTVTLDQNTGALASLTINAAASPDGPGQLDCTSGKTITTTGDVKIAGILRATTLGNALIANVGGNLILNAGGRMTSNTSGAITVANNMTTNASSEVDLANSSVSITIQGDLTNNATAANACTQYGTGAFNFGNGSGRLTINGKLTNSTNACIKIGDNVSGNGLYVGGDTANLGNIYANTASAVLEFAGNLSNGNAGVVTSTWGTSVILRKDYKNNNSSFVPSNRWIFRGSVAQSILGAATTFNYIEIDNPAGVTLSGGNLTVGVDTSNATQRLTLTSGKLNTGNYKVTLSKSCDSSTLTRSNGWINGNLTYNTMPQGDYDCVFPVGDANNYAPVAVRPNLPPPASGTLTVRTDAGDNADVTTGITGINPAVSVNRTWTLTPGGTPALDYAANQYLATFQFCNGVSAPACTVSDVDAGADPNQFVIAQKSGSAWSQPTVGSRTNNRTQATGLSAFGTFALGAPYAPKLLAEYRFDECAQYTNTPGEVRDATGNSPGTPMTDLQNVETGGKLGRHADFTRGQTYVNVPAGPFLFNWTVSTWFKKPFANNTDHKRLYYTLGSVAGGGDFLSLDRNNGFRWGVYTKAASDSAGVGGTTWGTYQFSGLADGWHHVAVVGSGNTTSLYVDGVKQDAVARKVKGQLQFVGGSFDGAGDAALGQSFGTPLDEFKVFNNALDASAITQLYNNENAGNNWDTGTPRAAVNCSTTCVVDNFASGSLNPALWNAAAVSGNFVPAVVDVNGQKRIRMTQATGNQATMLQLKKWYPGAGNKIVVDFDYYVYGGNGADGVAVVFSDANVTPAPGGFGGSLGYAQRNGGISGFAGGWLAVGLDEYGNFPNKTENRTGYPSGWTPPAGAAVAAGGYKNNVSVRGSGSGSTGYALLANTGTVSPVLWASSNTSSSLNKFRITIDHSNNINAFVTVERDTGSGSYTTVVPKFDAKAAPGQAAVPANWLVSFTGSTGGANSIHELTNVSICATTVTDPGGSVVAQNFECMDGSLAQDSYINRQVTPGGRNPIYTKLARTGFPLRVVPIKADGSVEVAAPFTDTQVEVFDVSTGTEPACNALPSSSRIGGPAAINFLRVSDLIKVNTAVKKARCRVTYTDPASAALTQGCGSDLFAVRPGKVNLAVTSATAGGPSASSTTTVKAGANFTLRATTSTSSSDAYSGTLIQNTGAMTAQTTAQDSSKANGGVVGTLTPASLVANAAAVNASYSEVGYLYMADKAYQDTAFTAIDQNGDCVANSNNTALSSNKYGCVIGTSAKDIGRFIPDHFDVTPNDGSMQTACGSNFTYTGQSMTYGTAPSLTIKAMNGLATPGVTQNYSGAFQKLKAENVVINSPTEDATQLGKDGTTKTALTANTDPTANTPPPATLATGTLPGFNDSPPIYTSGTMTYTLKTAASPVASNTDRFTYTRNANALVAPYISAIWLPVASVIDSDTVEGTGLPTLKPTGVNVRYGRARMLNAFGSELLDLPVPFRVEYLANPPSGWVLNTDDACTKATLSKAPAGTNDITGFTCALETGNESGIGCNVPLTTTQTNRAYLEAGLTGTDSAGVPGFAGNFNLWLKAPGKDKTGAINITADVDSWLEYNWTGSVSDPKSLAAFGIYGSKSPIIYRRENY